LGGAAIKAAMDRSGVAPELVGEVLFGNCLMAGQGQLLEQPQKARQGLVISRDLSCQKTMEHCSFTDVT